MESVFHWFPSPWNGSAWLCLEYCWYYVNLVPRQFVKLKRTDIGLQDFDLCNIWDYENLYCIVRSCLAKHQNAQINCEIQNQAYSSGLFIRIKASRAFGSYESSLTPIANRYSYGSRKQCFCRYCREFGLWKHWLWRSWRLVSTAMRVRTQAIGMNCYRLRWSISRQFTKMYLGIWRTSTTSCEDDLHRDIDCRYRGISACYFHETSRNIVRNLLYLRVLSEWRFHTWPFSTNSFFGSCYHWNRLIGVSQMLLPVIRYSHCIECWSPWLCF